MRRLGIGENTTTTRARTTDLADRDAAEPALAQQRAQLEDLPPERADHADLARLHAHRDAARREQALDQLDDLSRNAMLRNGMQCYVTPSVSSITCGRGDEPTARRRRVRRGRPIPPRMQGRNQPPRVASGLCPHSLGDPRATTTRRRVRRERPTQDGWCPSRDGWRNCRVVGPRSIRSRAVPWPPRSG